MTVSVSSCGQSAGCARSDEPASRIRATGTNTAPAAPAAVAGDDGDIAEAISRLDEPMRSILAALLGRVRELEGEVRGLREHLGEEGGLGGLDGRVESLEETVGGIGGSGLEETVDRVERLEEEVGELRGAVEDARL